MPSCCHSAAANTHTSEASPSPRHLHPGPTSSTDACHHYHIHLRRSPSPPHRHQDHHITTIYIIIIITPQPPSSQPHHLTIIIITTMGVRSVGRKPPPWGAFGWPLAVGNARANLEEKVERKDEKPPISYLAKRCGSSDSSGHAYFECLQERSIIHSLFIGSLVVENARANLEEKVERKDEKPPSSYLAKRTTPGRISKEQQKGFREENKLGKEGLEMRTRRFGSQMQLGVGTINRCSRKLQPVGKRFVCVGTSASCARHDVMAEEPVAPPAAAEAEPKNPKDELRRRNLKQYFLCFLLGTKALWAKHMLGPAGEDLDCVALMRSDQMMQRKMLRWTWVRQYYVRKESFAAKGVVIDGEWVTDPKMVKETFRERYATKFQQFNGIRPSNRSPQCKSLSNIHVEMLERTFSNQEIQDVGPSTGRPSIPIFVYSCHGGITHSDRRRRLKFSVQRGDRGEPANSHVTPSYANNAIFMDENVQELDMCIGCGADLLPFVYLGLPIEESMYRINSWRPLVIKFQKRLATWKSKLMSIGGGLTLAKSASMELHKRDFIPYSAIRRKVGNGMNTRFWKDVWCGDRTLEDRFPRMASLAYDRNASVIEYSSSQGWNISWRLGGERFEWKFDDEESFMVRTIRNSLDVSRLPFASMATRWCKILPIKVNVFVWRAMLNRLPTHASLDSRGIDIDSLLCSGCNINVEDINHVFYSCNLALELCNRFALWLDLHIPEFVSMVVIFQWID
ncbi:RNA-directed DNA polymerase, eukaryota [Tanacetum coccineum]